MACITENKRELKNKYKREKEGKHYDYFRRRWNENDKNND